MLQITPLEMRRFTTFPVVIDWIVSDPLEKSFSYVIEALVLRVDYSIRIKSLYLENSSTQRRRENENNDCTMPPVEHIVISIKREKGVAGESEYVPYFTLDSSSVMRAISAATRWCLQRRLAHELSCKFLTVAWPNRTWLMNVIMSCRFKQNPDLGLFGETHNRQLLHRLRKIC